MEENHKISKKDGEWVTEEEGKGGGGRGHGGGARHGEGI